MTRTDILTARRAVNRAIKICQPLISTQAFAEASYKLAKLLLAYPKTITERQASGLKSLMREADRVFSEYVRLLYSNGQGVVRCYTCDTPHDWRHLDCGHFIKRQYTLLRFNILNTAPQCKECNYVKQGNDAEFERRLTAECGAERVLWLRANQKRKKWSRWELRALIDDYSARVFLLKKARGIK